MRSLFTMLFFATIAQGESQVAYQGTARDKEGKVVYLEKHELVRSSAGTVLQGVTEYTRVDGEVIGRLKSDFVKKLTTPPYTFEDLRDGSSHGIELVDDKYVLWKKEKNRPREEVAFKSSDFDNSALVVGCQGLHYYLVDNLSSLTTQKELPIKYLIPGKLDYYSFTLMVEREDEEFLHLKVRVDSLILRIFIPSLDLKYRKKDRRLVGYQGLSNIPADNGDIQNIVLDYQYDASRGVQK